MQKVRCAFDCLLGSRLLNQFHSAVSMIYRSRMIASWNDLVCCFWLIEVLTPEHKLSPSLPSSPTLEFRWWTLRRREKKSPARRRCTGKAMDCHARLHFIRTYPRVRRRRRRRGRREKIFLWFSRRTHRTRRWAMHRETCINSHVDVIIILASPVIELMSRREQRRWHTYIERSSSDRSASAHGYFFSHWPSVHRSIENGETVNWN